MSVALDWRLRPKATQTELHQSTVEEKVRPSGDDDEAAGHSLGDCNRLTQLSISFVG